MRGESEMIEVMKQALEALEAGDWYISQLEPFVYLADEEGTHEERSKVQLAIAALRAAIAEATINETETVEPVAWLQIGGPLHDNNVIARTTKPKEWNPEWWRFEPLYTHPPRREWVGLTDEEIIETYNEACREHFDDLYRVRHHARAIEAKLKERNT